jgi:hypothetical protein
MCKQALGAMGLSHRLSAMRSRISGRREGDIAVCTKAVGRLVSSSRALDSASELIVFVDQRPLSCLLFL